MSLAFVKTQGIKSLCSHTLKGHTRKAAIDNQAAGILKGLVRTGTLSFPAHEGRVGLRRPEDAYGPPQNY